MAGKLTCLFSGHASGAAGIATPLIALLLILAFSAAPARASTGFGFTGSFGSAGSGNGEFKEPVGVAVSDDAGATEGDVYVVDKGNNRVEQFNAAGAFEDQFNGNAGPPKPLSSPEAIAVDNSGKTTAEDESVGDVYVADVGNGVVDKFSATGVYQGQITGTCAAPGSCSGSVIPFGTLRGVAVDLTGNLWVSNFKKGTGHVDEFSDTGSFVQQFNVGGSLVQPSLAVDPSGNVYWIAGFEPNTNAVKLEPTLPHESEFGVARTMSALAVAPATGDVLVDSGSAIAEYEPSGEPLKEHHGQPLELGAKQLADGGGQGIAVAASGAVYVVDATADKVDIFGEGPTPEAPLTEETTAVTEDAAVFHGELNPAVKATTGWYFEYAKGASCEGEGGEPFQKTTHEPEAEVEKLNVSKAVPGLEPNAEYTVCLVAENGFGPTVGAPAPSFRTQRIPPKVDSESVSGLTPFAATIEAQINPNNLPTLCKVEYGTDPTLTTGTNLAKCTLPALGFGDKLVSAPIPDPEEKTPALEADTTYYYRLILKIPGEELPGPIRSFKTVGSPLATTGEAQGVTRVTAALSGMIDPERGATSYHFAYIDQAGYEAAFAKGAENPYAEGAVTTQGEVPAGDASQAVQPLSAVGLLPETTYHYALIATNEAGTITGHDDTFTTGAATPPTVATGAVSEVTLSTATLSGTVGTQGLDVSYAFKVSTEPGNLGPASGAGAVGAGATEASVSVALQGLQPRTTYYYRLVATSIDGTSEGAVLSFTTTGFQSAFTLPVPTLFVAAPTITFPAEAATSTTKRLTSAQRLARALAACKAKKNRKKRASCNAQARKKFGTRSSSIEKK